MLDNIDTYIEDTISEELKIKISNLPTAPGIYQYRNSAGKIIYIGKAKNLRSRVRSYFRNNRPKDAKTNAMVNKIADVEVTVVSSEAQALILEDSLIKQHKPRYNIMLRDDKTYPFIRITNDEYPKIFKTRTVIKDGSKYYGPYTEVWQLNILLKLLRSIIKYRTCNLKLNEADIAAGKFKVCLDYHIGKCSAPCINKVSKAEYNSAVKYALQILQGKTKDLENELTQKMLQLSEELKFEEAAEIRNQINLLREYLNSQKTVTSEFKDRDVIGYYEIDNVACSLIFIIREGKIIGKKHYIITNAALQSKEDILQSTIEKWYMNAEIIPEEILTDTIPEESHFIIDWLKTRKGKTVELVVPKLGEKKKILDLANINAEFLLREYLLAIAKKDNLLSKPVLALQKDLNMPKAPLRIECFDNSHIQGSDYVSSMVCFIDGKPKKSEYRKFKLRDIYGNDDFAAMREVIRRRYSRVIEENTPLPDLIIIDGGKGQLSSAMEIIKELAIADKVTVIGLAKRLEEVFFPNQKEAVLLPKTSSGLKLIQQLRDEAHRFAIEYHRLLRDKRTLKSELTNIPGIGEITTQKLLKHFGSVKNIKLQDIHSLSTVIGRKNAEEVIKYYNEEG